MKITNGKIKFDRKIIAFLIKITILMVSAAILVKMIDWQEFWLSLKQTSPWIFSLVVALNLIAALVMALRWHSLILASGYHLSLRLAASYTMLGLFFNQIMPGSISGDAARIWCLGGRRNSLKKSAGTVIWDRILGLEALIFITLGFMPFYYDRVMGAKSAALAWTALFMTILFFLSLQSTRFLIVMERLVGKIWNRLKGEEGDYRIKTLFASLRSFLTDRILMVKTFMLSLVIRSLWLIGAWIISSSMDLRVPLAFFFFFIPVIELIRMLPVSIQGLGVRELAFVFFLKPIGISAANAALLSMLFFTALTVSGLIGGLLYLGREFWGGGEGVG